MRKKNLIFFGLLFFGLAANAQNKILDPVDYVNPLMGTQSVHSLSNGNTYPAIARPWGMNFWTPQTGEMETDGFIRILLKKYVVSNKPISHRLG